MSQPILFPCQHCGASLELTPEYVSQYGGGNTACPGCGQSFTIPLPAEVTPAEQSAAVAPIAEPAGSAPGYAAPLYPPTPTEGVWADGKVLVIARGALIPARCYRCNEPALKSAWMRLTYTPAARVGPFSVRTTGDSFFNGRTIDKKFWVCASHAAKDRTARRAGIVLAFVGAAVAVAAVALMARTDTRNLTQINRLICALVGGVIVSAIGFVWRVQPRRRLTSLGMDRHATYVAGCGRPFLESLPPAPPSD